jgi:predicted dehydrogenase
MEGRTNKGKLNNPHQTHQTTQMNEMAGIIFNGKQPVIPVDGYEAVKDLKIIEAIYLAVKTGKKVNV